MSPDPVTSIVRLIDGIIGSIGKLGRFVLLMVLLIILLIGGLKLAIWAEVYSPTPLNISIGPTSGTAYLRERSDPDNMRPIKDIVINADVITIDYLRFDSVERSTLRGYQTRYPLATKPLSIVLKGFHIMDILDEAKYPTLGNSFKRFKELESNTRFMEEHSLEQRRAVLLDEGYWRNVNRGTTMGCFPLSEQRCAVVLRLKGVLDGTTPSVIPAPQDRNDPYGFAIYCTHQNGRLTATEKDGLYYACLFPGEALQMESKGYSWTLTIKDAYNMPWFRGDDDMAIVQWSADPRQPH